MGDLDKVDNNLSVIKGGTLVSMKFDEVLDPEWDKLLL